jgi:GntR family transcriptional repressor for pyruvate dehydrogenase complex
MGNLPANNADIEALTEAIRGLIVDGKKLPPERKLGEQLNVNRYTLRKALISLRATGELASSMPRRQAAIERGGAALARNTNPLEVIELRLAFEPILARLAALRASPVEIARIEKAATTLAETESSTADLTFHLLIASATRNTLAAELYSLLRKIGADSRIHLQHVRSRPPSRLRQRDSEHHLIAAAIAARDPDGAEKAMRAHLHMVQCQILDRISLNPSDTSTD